MKVLLYAPEYRPNLSNMIRSAEFFGLKEIYIYDKNGLLNPPSNKVSRADMNHMARVWTAGAIEHIEIVVIDDVGKFISSHEGRSISTVVDKDAKSIYNFDFKESDMIIMGSEKDGLPLDFQAITSRHIYIPQEGHTDCLNVAVTLGICLYAMKAQVL